jgi:hypothetical protein
MRSSEFGVFLLLVTAVLAVIVVVLYFRHRNLQMLHQERMSAIEKGTTVPIGRTLAPWSPRVYLLRGLIWTLTGAALVIFLYGVSISSHRAATGESIMWSARNLSRFAQIPIEQAQQIVEKDQANREQSVPAAIALLGLIPIGVGLSYLIFYYTDESRLKPVKYDAPAES